MIPRYRAYYDGEIAEVTQIDYKGNWICNEPCIAIEGSCDFLPMNEIKLMESIELKGNDGLEIFEGYIVKHEAGEYSFVGVVKKDCYQFYIDLIGRNDTVSFSDVADTSDCTADLTIIGNIYENPELLEVVE